MPRQSGYTPPAGGEPAPPVSYPVLFLRDALRHISAHADRYGCDLASLWLGDAPVFLSRMEGGEVAAMNVGEEDVTLERGGVTHRVSARSAVRLGVQSADTTRKSEDSGFPLR